jgi:hypothetical protein
MKSSRGIGCPLLPLPDLQSRPVIARLDRAIQ